MLGISEEILNTSLHQVEDTAKSTITTKRNRTEARDRER